MYLRGKMKSDRNTYYDVSLHPKAAALIRENLDWFSPHEVSKKVVTIYPSITAKQVHTAWTTVTFLDYLYAFHTQTYLDCSFPFILIHSPGVSAIFVPLHCDPCYHCTI